MLSISYNMEVSRMNINYSYLNLSSRFLRPEALKLCRDFYDPFFIPESFSYFKNIEFEEIGNWNDQYISNSRLLSENPALTNILKYIYFSHLSYMELIAADNAHQLTGYISFHEYEELSEQVMEKLRNEFSHLSIADLYSDSISMPLSASYPLQHMNIFFNQKDFSFLNQPQTKDIFDNQQPVSILKTLSKVLKQYGLEDIKFKLLRRDISDSRSSFFIPKCCIFSLTFVLLAFESGDIPVDFQYMILSDFIINLCIANHCTPYEILNYLVIIKKNFPQRIFLESKRKFISRYQKKLKDAINLIENKAFAGSKDCNVDHQDDVFLFWKFSTSYFDILKQCSDVHQTMKTFREIENYIIKKQSEDTLTETDSGELSKEDYEKMQLENYYIDTFLKKFHQNNTKSYQPISSADLYEFLTTEYCSNIFYVTMLNTLESICLKKEFLSQFKPFYYDCFFNHIS